MALEDVAEQYAKDQSVPAGVPALPSAIADKEERLAVVKKILKREKNRVQVRGFELARLHPSGEWEQLQTYKPGDRGLQRAAADAAWLNERHPNTLYQARVLVSAEIPDVPSGNQSNDGAEPRSVADATTIDGGGNTPLPSEEHPNA